MLCAGSAGLNHAATVLPEDHHLHRECELQPGPGFTPLGKVVADHGGECWHCQCQCVHGDADFFHRWVSIFSTPMGGSSKNFVSAMSLSGLWLAGCDVLCFRFSQRAGCLGITLRAEI